MPNHVIRDRIWTSKKLALCTTKAALAYPWIYLVCDDWGRFEYEPEMIRNQVFPRRSDISIQDVKDWLIEYEMHGLLIRYHMDKGLAYWTKFWRGGHRKPSELPDPKEFEGVEQVGGENGTYFALPTEHNTTQQNRTEAARILIDAYNRILDCRIGYTAGNVDAAKRGLEHGYTVDQAVEAFEAIQAKSTPTAKWCAENNHGFEYLTRPPYKSRQSGALTLGPIEKIGNELASVKPRGQAEGPAARRARLEAEASARKAEAS